MSKNSFKVSTWKKSFHDESDASSEDTALIEDQIPQLHPRRGLKRPGTRALAEVFMVFAIIGLSAILFVKYARDAAKPKPFGPILPKKVVTFGSQAKLGPDVVYSDHEMLMNATRLREIHENWQGLYPTGRGYVLVPESSEYIINNPPFSISGVITPDDKRQGWIMAVYHQLHCLSIITTRLGIGHEGFKTWDHPHLEHVSHCVEYLRQSILCAGDTSLEGETGSWTTSTGWGQKHLCVDFDALKKFGNDHASWDLSDAREVDLNKRPGPQPKQEPSKDSTKDGKDAGAKKKGPY